MSASMTNAAVSARKEPVGASREEDVFVDAENETLT
jgi:hypothetical protein